MHASVLLGLLLALGCHGPRVKAPPHATADQSVRDAVVLVCAAPTRAAPDASDGVSRSDAIAGHLTDGIGNDRVLITAEGWKTNGIDVTELTALMKEAKITHCALRDTLGNR